MALVIALIAYAGSRQFFHHPPVKNPRPAGETIICFGDSLTYGTGASPGTSIKYAGLPWEMGLTDRKSVV